MAVAASVKHTLDLAYSIEAMSCTLTGNFVTVDRFVPTDT